MALPSPRIATGVGPGRPTHLLRQVACSLAALCLAVLCACEEEVVATLIPLSGCGLEEGRLNGLTIRARGDFPATPAAQLPVATPGDELRDLPEDVRGITVEGKFGESIEAVGRTARLASEGPLPVYFSPPDELCPISPEVPGRTVGALAVTPGGHALAVGGRSPNGLLVQDIVYMRDIEGEVTQLDEVLPLPATGQTLHAIDDETLLVVGGAGTNRTALRSIARIDLVDPPQVVHVSDPIPIEVPGRIERGRAYHGSVRLLDGRIAVVGGCSAVDEEGNCVASADAVTRTGFVMQVDGDPPTFEAIPDLIVPRYAHAVLRADDGVLFAVGGRGVDGEGVRTVEVFLPMSGAWAPYGPSLLDILDDGQIITGATLLEGGLIVIVLDDGSVYWLDQTNLGRLEGWCDAGQPPCFSSPGPFVPTRRHPATLAGERVVIDNFVLPVALLGLTGLDALNLSDPQLDPTHTPPGPRIGAHAILLADGSLLQAGGVNPISGLAQDPLFLRLRPPLDGPDEAIPDVSNLAAGTFVAHDAGADGGHITLVAGRLEFVPDPTLPSDVLSTWVHVRGFRSERFRLELTLEAIREARPRLVFSRGAVARVIVSFDDQVRYTRTEPTGGGLTITCDGPPLDLPVAKSIRVDVAPDRIEIESDQTITCPGIGEGQVAVGLGAAGDGTIRATGLRLSRN